MPNYTSVKFINNIFSYNKKLSEVFSCWNSLKIKLLLVTKKKRFIGTVTDGDIRRFFMGNVSQDTKIENIMNKKPKFIFEGSNTSQIKLPNIIRYLPVLNKKREIQSLLDLNNTKGFKHPNSVLIIAGGKGERLKPLTDKIPKPMLTINKKPHLENLIDKIQQSGFDDIVLSVNYKASYIKNYFQKKKIFFSSERKRLGTAGPILLASNNKKLNFPILIINADLITDLDLSNLVNYSKKIKYDLIICVKENKIRLPFAIVNHKNDTVLKIQEKPEQKYYFNTGIYLLKKNTLKLIPKNKKFDMPDLINKAIKKKMKIKSFFMYESWLDFGTKKNFDIAKKNAS